ncbi:MAG: thioredoxin family protein, partial [Candidatus Babeliales bacterium]
IKSIVEFDNIVTKNSGFVIVDFYADYCPSCLQMLPVIDAVSQEFNKKATFVKIDVEVSEELVKKLFVHKVPCLLVFQNGQLVARYNKAMTKKELSTLLEQLIS